MFRLRVWRYIRVVNVVVGFSPQLWQGYGGNIYFNAVRCQSMRINSAKYGKLKKDFTKRWKSKSCTPLNRKDGYQTQPVSSAKSDMDIAIPSSSNLGSLSRLRQFNTQLKGRDIAASLERGFPTLISDSSFFLHSDHRSSSVVTTNADPFVKLPVLGNSDGKHRNSKTENGSSTENNSNEPRPVFIIPFGAFDDPVESEPELKRKADKGEKPLSKSLTDRNNNSPGSLKEAKKFSGKTGQFCYNRMPRR